MSEESEKATGAEQQTVRVRMIQGKAGGADWHQTMQGHLGHLQDFCLYPKRDRMSLGLNWWHNSIILAS